MIKEIDIEKVTEETDYYKLKKNKKKTNEKSGR